MEYGHKLMATVQRQRLVLTARPSNIRLAESNGNSSPLTALQNGACDGGNELIFIFTHLGDGAVHRLGDFIRRVARQIRSQCVAIEPAA